jgi:hypothetical protein
MLRLSLRTNTRYFGEWTLAILDHKKKAHSFGFFRRIRTKPCVEHPQRAIERQAANLLRSRICWIASSISGQSAAERRLEFGHLQKATSGKFLPQKAKGLEDSAQGFNPVSTLGTATQNDAR